MNPKTNPIRAGFGGLSLQLRAVGARFFAATTCPFPHARLLFKRVFRFIVLYRAELWRQFNKSQGGEPLHALDGYAFLFDRPLLTSHFFSFPVTTTLFLFAWNTFPGTLTTLSSHKNTRSFRGRYGAKPHFIWS